MRIKVVRNWLNFLFIIGAIVGLIMYYKVSRETGIYVILGSMMIKFTESALRMMYKNEEYEETPDTHPHSLHCTSVAGSSV